MKQRIESMIGMQHTERNQRVEFAGETFDATVTMMHEGSNAGTATIDYVDRIVTRRDITKAAWVAYKRRGE